MSLQLIAKQMEAKGRKGDSMLVHMTPGEVAGLQKLAESAGGTLTVNPETGLVEANFLKRMLPTLVGVGVGIGTGNPFLGAAAGAAVGGVQAKENKQDVGMGMLMGGLGGYGGAGLGAGLTAAGGTAAAAGAAGATTGAAGTTVAGQQAAQMTAEQVAQQQAAELAAQQAAQTANQVSGAEAANLAMQNPAAAATAEGTIGEAAAQQAAQQAAAQPTTYTFDDGSTLSAFRDGTTTSTPGTDVVVAKPELTTAQRFSQAGDGIGQMATKEGRAAFGQEFGFTEAGAGIAPLMAPGKAPGKAPVDDEMYSYEYNPGRTGAERNARVGSSERTYFDGGFSPVRKIKASQYGMAAGGLMSLAEGGSTTAKSGTSSEGMSGASKAAFDYLMGASDTSDYEGQGRITQGKGGYSFASNSHMYGFDPVTGTFIRNPNYQDPEEVERQRRAAEAAAAAAAAAARESSGGGGGSHEPLNVNYPSGGGDYHSTQDPNSPDFIGPRGPTSYYGSNFHNESPGVDSWSGNMSDYAGSSIDQGDRGEAAGGLISLAKGGMASGGFVVPADVVSALGNGSTDAGLRKLHAMLGKIKPIKGKGDGLSDSIPTHIDGKQRAKVADGEAYIDPKTVKRVGGAKKLYAMMDKVRAQAHGKTSQQRPVNPAKVMA